MANRLYSKHETRYIASLQNKFLKMKKILSILAALGLIFFQSCGNKADFEQSVSPATGARLKFYHAAPDAPGVNIFVNDVKISGANTVSPFPPAAQTTPNLLIYGNSFPNIDYATLAAGSTNIKVSVPTTATTTETIAVTATGSFDDGKFYSIYAYGVAPTYSALILTDDFTVADPKKAYVRFVNLLNPSATIPTPNFDFIVNGVIINTAVGYAGKNAAFTAIDPTVYGGTKVPVSVKSSALTFSGTATFSFQPYAGRFYTIFTSGIIGSAGAKAPTIYVSTNK